MFWGFWFTHTTNCRFVKKKSRIELKQKADAKQAHRKKKKTTSQILHGKQRFPHPNLKRYSSDSPLGCLPPPSPPLKVEPDDEETKSRNYRLPSHYCDSAAGKRCESETLTHCILSVCCVFVCFSFGQAGKREDWKNEGERGPLRHSLASNAHYA